MSRLYRALCNFLRGFTGLTPLGRDPDTVRHTLEHRAATRKTCC